jgi:hypothetical protein
MKIEKRVPGRIVHGPLQGFATFALAASISACSSAPNCDEPQFYESAQGGTRIAAPQGLDNLEPSKEMVIPEASPRPAREPGSGCLDRPPTLRIGDAEEETET